jgi:dTDP-4-dehydrorhamnose reductase
MGSVLVLGGSGLVGSRLRALWPEVLAPSHTELDVLQTDQLARYLEHTRPDTVINLAAWADVDGAEAQRGDESGLAFQLNAALPAKLAQQCKERGIHLVHVSTDYVFDGMQDDQPYVETDRTNPLCWYAVTKLRGEELLRALSASACLARIEMPYMAQAHAKGDLARLCVRRLASGQTMQAVTDQRITPVFLDDAVAAIRKLAEQRGSGIFHVASASWTTPYEFVRGIAERCGLQKALIVPTRFADFARARPARRPQHSWLAIERVQAAIGAATLRTVDAQLDAWAKQLLVVHGHA